MDWLPPNPALSTTLAEIEAKTEPGWGRPAAQNVKRLGSQAQLGDFVWTRDTHGRYLLCRLTGPYRYDGSAAAKTVDVHQVRNAESAPRPLNDLEVPRGVIRAFVGVSAASTTRARGISRHTCGRHFTAVTTRAPTLTAPNPDESSRPYDVEDLVYVWLQIARGFIALPRARQRDTPAYEWSTIQRETRGRGIVQIKTGSTPVALTDLGAAVSDDATDTYAYATSGTYVGGGAAVTEVIQDADLLALVAQ